MSAAVASPGRVLRLCAQQPCRELVESGRCAKHRSAPDEHRGSSHARGYDAHHHRLRILCFQRDEWRCVDCGWEPDIVRRFRLAGLGLPATGVILEELRAQCNSNQRHLHADHVIQIDERPDLRLDLDNLATRCDGCHARKTRAEHAQNGSK